MKNFLYIIFVFLISCNQKKQEEKVVKTEEEILIENINAKIKSAKFEVEKRVPKDSIYNFFHSALPSNRIFNQCECLMPFNNEVIVLNNDQAEESLSRLQEHFEVSNEEDFIKNQFQASLGFEWDESLVKGKRVVRIDDEIYKSENIIEEFSKFMESQGCCLTYVSMPIFFDNFQKCVVEVDSYCGGECAERASFIYQRDEKGNWKEIKEYDRILA